MPHFPKHKRQCSMHLHPQRGTTKIYDAVSAPFLPCFASVAGLQFARVRITGLQGILVERLSDGGPRGASSGLAPGARFIRVAAQPDPPHRGGGGPPAADHGPVSRAGRRPDGRAEGPQARGHKHLAPGLETQHGRVRGNRGHDLEHDQLPVDPKGEGLLHRHYGHLCGWVAREGGG